MTYDVAINRLKGFRDSIKTANDFGAWMDASFEVIEDYFGNGSIQSKNYMSLIVDYRGQKSYEQYGTQGGTRTLFTPRFIEKLNYLIDEIEVRRNMAIMKEDKTSLTPAIETLQEDEQYQKATDKKHYTIGIAIFWTVAIALAGGIFMFGFYVGNTKFDKDKNEMYEQIKDLEKENQSLKETWRPGQK